MEKDKETKATEEREGSQVNQNVVDFGSAMNKNRPRNRLYAGHHRTDRGAHGGAQRYENHPV